MFDKMFWTHFYIINTLNTYFYNILNHPFHIFFNKTVLRGSAINAFSALTHGKSKTTVMFAQEIPCWLADGDDYICTVIPSTDMSTYLHATTVSAPWHVFHAIQFLKAHTLEQLHQSMHNIPSILHLKPTFSIFHYHFYKIFTSVYLFYKIFQ